MFDRHEVKDDRGKEKKNPKGGVMVSFVKQEENFQIILQLYKKRVLTGCHCE